MKYSRKSLDRAGRSLLDPFSRSEVIEMVSSWRMTHLPVLRTFVDGLTAHLHVVGVPFAFYSQRVKRMTSIIDKLRNNPKMGLGGLQDIGGARFVFDTIEDMERCHEVLENFVPDGLHSIGQPTMWHSLRRADTEAFTMCISTTARMLNWTD